MGGQVEQWIKNDITKYKDIFKKNNQKEVALSRYTLCMVKILNGLAEIGMTEFYKYEKRILWDAMKLFSKHCQERIQYALECKEVKEKKRVLTDIENSIAQMMEVFKNIFDGTGNAERQMFQSLLVDTNMYELSPKLCAFYSDILKEVVELFSEEKRKYAFVMYPTLRSTTEAKTLLKTREEPGKVVVVYISESEIEQFNMMPIFLVHEAFHVITKKERYRQERAANLAVNMMEYMELFLFHEVDFFEDDKGLRIKEDLMKYWFNDIIILMSQWEKENKDDKKFYSANIEKELSNKIKKCLTNIYVSLENDVFEYSYEVYQEESYSAFRQHMGRLKQAAKQIRNNLNEIVLGNMVSQSIYLMMFLYRETYADIACILTLQLEAQRYKDAFAGSIQFGFDKDEFQDITRWIRDYLVTKTVSQFSLGSDKGWREHLDELENEKDGLLSKAKINQQKKGEERAGHFDGTCDRMGKIQLVEPVMRRSCMYLGKCAAAFSERLLKVDGAQKFRKNVTYILDSDKNKLLTEIVSGKINLN